MPLPPKGYKPRRPPATGIVRWLEPAPNGNRQLLITVTSGAETVYEVVQESTGFSLLRLGRDGEPVVVKYRVCCHNMRYWSCTCPDAQNSPGRDGNCKHVRGLRAALRALPF